MAYLNITDPISTAKLVKCDGYYVRIYTHDSSSANFGNIYKLDAATSLFTITSTLRDTSDNDYYFGETSGEQRVMWVEENTPKRVVLVIQGKHQTAGGTLLPNETYTRYRFIFLPDRFFVDAMLVASGSITTKDQIGYNAFLKIYTQAANVTNEDLIHESSGSEVDPGTYVITTGDYFGMTSDEVNCIGVTLDQSGEFQQYVGGSEAAFQWTLNNASLSAGTYFLRCAVIVDTAQREYSSKLYNSTARLAMGDQYKDLELD